MFDKAALFFPYGSLNLLDDDPGLFQVCRIIVDFCSIRIEYELSPCKVRGCLSLTVRYPSAGLHAMEPHIEYLV